MQKGVVRKRAPAPLSEYGRQLKEKQTLKMQYALRERQFRNYVKKALSLGRKGSGNALELLMRTLERRLDNVVFRMGMAQTRAQARQLVTHGHFVVKGKPIDVPSYQVELEDVVSVRPSSLKKELFKNIQLGLKKYQPPAWLELNSEKMEAKMLREPTLEEASATVELPLIFEFYSR